MSNGSPFPQPSGQRSIKAIDTRYRGFLFRSRTEARWAVFFDWCKIEWEYEPGGYVLSDGSRYLPDFYIKREFLNLHFEVKGELPESVDTEKLRRLVIDTGRAGAVFHGAPGDNYGSVYCWDDESEGMIKVPGCKFTGDRMDPEDSVFLCRPGKDCFSDYYSDREKKNPLLVSGMDEPEKNTVVSRAIAIAKEARFEHGSNPAPPWLR